MCLEKKILKIRGHRKHTAALLLRKKFPTYHSSCLELSSSLPPSPKLLIGTGDDLSEKAGFLSFVRSGVRLRRSDFNWELVVDDFR